MNKGIKLFLGIVSVVPIVFLLGLALSLFVYVEFPIQLVHSTSRANILLSLGAIIILAGTLLAFFAQKISRVISRPSVKATCADLMMGPYKYSRHAGSLALMTMYVGFVLVTNSLVLLIVAVGFILLITFIFAPMEEKVISELCPEAYAEYKTKVRMWF